MKYKKIENVIRGDERAFYASNCVIFNKVKTQGVEDGESAFKECKNIEIKNSKLYLRYPCWHDTNCKLINTRLSVTARAPFWYDKNISFERVYCKGVKAIRECKNVNINNSKFVSPEICWKCQNIKVSDSDIESVYAFFGSSNIELNNVHFKGKYSFQYVKNMTISNSVLDTKDAFWHTNNVTVKNSVIKGEYLGWYSKNLTLIDCKIIGTQPLCYCKQLTLINCTTEACDLSFENSEVNAEVKGDIVSIKNPISGTLNITGKFEYLKDENDRSKGRFKVIKK